MYACSANSATRITTATQAAVSIIGNKAIKTVIRELVTYEYV
ncbi:hypothetical protein [Clostridium aciditolerans]|nr:hypothetical protein [Clostridium aciditolerans]